MEKVKKLLENADILLANMEVKGDNVFFLSDARKSIKQAYDALKHEYEPKGDALDEVI